MRNYEAAARKIGGEILSDNVRTATIRVAKNGQETWVALEAFNEGREYELNIIERQTMKQDVVADAAALRSGLKENRHVFFFFFFLGGRAHGQRGPGGKQPGSLGRAPPRWSRPWCSGKSAPTGWRRTERVPTRPWLPTPPTKVASATAAWNWWPSRSVLAQVCRATNSSNPKITTGIKVSMA